MAQLTEDMVHYTKFSLSKWNGKQQRYKMNQSLRVTTNNQMLNYTWAFTRDSYEMWNSLDKHEDRDWSGFVWADQAWKELRKEFKQNVVLWVAKANLRQTYKAGAIQKNIRIPETVSLLSYFPKQDQLICQTRMSAWHKEFEFNATDHRLYNMTYDWRNPTTSVNGGTAPGGW